VALNDMVSKCKGRTYSIDDCPIIDALYIEDQQVLIYDLESIIVVGNSECYLYISERSKFCVRVNLNIQYASYLSALQHK